ncbi:hypothetical protein JMJ35_008650 [Cladonia borealis]|uniref:DUF1772-domain-containing protein n=1 Tax=Cladonia borealis TaxID=184061 RepID=A0AA39V2Z6_9LECA|nr:hypothetical protein JMJ35_008650 [Cladonia borealis]
MAPMPTAIRVAQTVGITASAFASGSILSLSYASVPSFLLAPSPILVRQWHSAYESGKIINPSISALSALSYAFLSYRLYGTLNHPKAEMYALSALLTVAIVPYTAIGMQPTNKKLKKKLEEMKGLDIGEKATEIGLAKGESAKELLDWWATLNFGRGIFPLVGAILGMWATLQ